MICVKYTVPHKQQIEKFEMVDNIQAEDKKRLKRKCMNRTKR